jgi:transcriptional regulator with XRE-family HTH domain
MARSGQNFSFHSMARPLPEISLEHLSRSLRQAREARAWTLEQLAHELWASGHPTSQNKLWRLENRPPRRVDTELLLWLEKVLGTELLAHEQKSQVLIEDVLHLVDAFAMAGGSAPLPPLPLNQGLRRIYERLANLLDARDPSRSDAA